jgi:hypothetical protein
MSESKPDCDSFSIINDGPSADKSEIVECYTGVCEVSCVHRGKTFLVCCVLLWFGKRSRYKFGRVL